jgi:dTDP-4-amino-4,6-dideoxygalactose transaminase
VTNKLVFNLGVYQMLRLASSASKDDDRFASGYQGDEVSLKGKMGRYTNYQARLGLRQLKTIEARNQRRTDNAERLIQQLDGQIPMQTPMKSDSDNYSNYMLVSLITARLSELASSFLRKGVDSKHLYMRDCSRMFEGEKAFPNAARAEREVLHIPAYPEMTNSEVDRVAASVSEAITELNG